MFRDKRCFWAYLKCIVGVIAGAGVGTESSETFCTKEPGIMTRPTVWPEDQESG